MLLLPGAEVRLSRLPGALRDPARMLPLARGVAATRRLSLRLRAWAARSDIGEELPGGRRRGGTALAGSGYIEDQGRCSGALELL